MTITEALNDEMHKQRHSLTTGTHLVTARCPTTLTYMPSQHDACSNWFIASWKGGREGRRERGRLQPVCDCATYNDFETHDDLAMQIHHRV